MKTKWMLFAILFLGAAYAQGQPHEAVLLWPEGAPGARGTTEWDKPSLTVYTPPPGQATGAAMVICPGGGYGGLASYEGEDYALYLNQFGVTGFVLNYRLGSHGYRHPAMLHDAARAVRLVRAKAAQWNVDPRRVGIMGSSAGGHLASHLMTQFDAGDPQAKDPIDRQSSRPDLGVLCYPVISSDPAISNAGSFKNLLGNDPTPELCREVSSELHVTPQTPPCFIFHTWEDQMVKLENALVFVDALRRNGVRFDLHIYDQGRHGVALNDKAPFKNVHPWARDLVFWLKAQGFVKAAPGDPVVPRPPAKK